MDPDEFQKKNKKNLSDSPSTSICVPGKPPGKADF
jgi:hypothetical protein